MNKFFTVRSVFDYALVFFTISVITFSMANTVLKVNDTVFSSSSKKEYNYVIKKGDKFQKILFSKFGIDTRSAYFISNLIEEVYPIDALVYGEVLKLKLYYSSEQLESMELNIRDEVVKINRVNGAYQLDMNLGKTFLKCGKVGNNLANAMMENNVPEHVIVSFIQLMKNEMNFRKNLSRESEFCVLFGSDFDKKQLVYGYVKTNKVKHEVYRYKDDGKSAYFNKEGKNIKRYFFYPVHNIKVSSHFGMRKHPVYGYNKMHTGVDFAAAKGTPILASADGIVHSVKYSRGYGKTILIKHDKLYTSLYAHMQRFGNNIKKGYKVRQGEVIGYVGNSGKTTGAHLHYEIRKNGIPVNPLHVHFSKRKVLSRAKLLSFKRHKERIAKIIQDDSSSRILLAKKY